METKVGESLRMKVYVKKEKSGTGKPCVEVSSAGKTAVQVVLKV